MDVALAATFSKPELRNINLCRLFYNALSTLSDLINASGIRLSPGISDGTILHSQSQPNGP
jgi:hypothetical protein